MLVHRAIVAFVALCFVSSGSTTAALHAQSLTDLSAAEAKRRATLAKEQQPAKDNAGVKTEKSVVPPTKVYTDKDSAAMPVLFRAVSGAKAPESATASPGELMGDGSRVVLDESWWRQHMTTLRNKLALDLSDCAPKQTAVARLSGMLNAIPDTAPAIVAGGYIAASGTIGTELIKARAELQQCQGRVAVDLNLIASAEEEARVRGVLPGWLR